MIRGGEARAGERRKMSRRKFGLTLAAAALSRGVLRAADPDYTIVIVPDTQYLSFRCAGAFNNMMQWVVNNLSASQGGVFSTNIKAVVGVGDCAQTGSSGQYTVAQTAYAKLDAAGIPWANPPGNHDYTAQTTDHLVNLGSGYLSGGYFAADYRRDNGTYGTLPTGGGASSWGGFYDTANYCIKLTVGGRSIIVFSVEFQPRGAVLAWAKGVHDANPGSECIVSTHSFLAQNATLTRFSGESGWTVSNGDNGGYGFDTGQALSDGAANSGHGIWNSYLNVWERLTMVVGGHSFAQPWNYAVSPPDYHYQTVGLTSTSSRAQTVQSIFCNWQQWDDSDVSYVNAGQPGASPDNNTYCTSLGSTYRVAHLMILQFRPSIGKLEGYILSTNSGLWEPTYANRAVPPGVTPNLLFSVNYTGVPPAASASVASGSAVSAGAVVK